MDEATKLPIGPEEVAEAAQILQRYKAGKAALDKRLVELPGMRMGDAYRLAHYNDALRQTAQTVEQGVVERIRQRSARPAENGTSPGGAAITRADVASMTRAQREALERRAMHGVKISF